MLHISYDSNTQSGLISNLTYGMFCKYTGIENKPVLSFEYSDLHFTDGEEGNHFLFEGEQYFLTEEVKAELLTVIDTWEQPLGQQGNPTEEQKLKAAMDNFLAMTEAHIRTPINDYNLANGLAFSDAHHCESWSRDDTYEHQAFCIRAWDFHRNVYKTVRAYQATMSVIPTDAEFQAVLDSVAW